jgi:hypothetical protein
MYLAIERAGDRPSVNRAILAARAAGAKFRNEEGRLWLNPFVNGARPALAPTTPPNDSPGTSPGTSPTSFIYARPDTRPEPRPSDAEKESENLAQSAPLARAKISNYQIDDDDDARAREASGLERSRLLCADAANIAIDAELLPRETDLRDFIALNGPMASQLIDEHGETELLRRWRQMVDAMDSGRLIVKNPTMAHLARLWPQMMSWEDRRRNGNLKAVGSARDAAKTSAKDDKFITDLRSAVKRGSARDAAKTSAKEPT